MILLVAGIMALNNVIAFAIADNIPWYGWLILNGSLFVIWGIWLLLMRRMVGRPLLG